MAPTEPTDLAAAHFAAHLRQRRQALGVEHLAGAINSLSPPMDDDKVETIEPKRGNTGG